ncbi:MAG: hypothetical protein R6U96_08800 [Promethearchaeia archaeon]
MISGGSNFTGKNGVFIQKKDSGKQPKEHWSAKKKSRICSKVELSFGIMARNYNFGRTHVRAIENVQIETSLVFSSWN